MRARFLVFYSALLAASTAAASPFAQAVTPAPMAAAHARLRLPTATPGSATAPSIRMSAGFSGHYKVGRWMPVSVDIENRGADVTGALVVEGIGFPSETGDRPAVAVEEAGLSPCVPACRPCRGAAGYSR